MWGFNPRFKNDSKSNKNNQSIKGGFKITNSSNDGQSAILMELLKINSRLEHIETKANNIHKAFNLYVQNNGVKPEIKEQVKIILEL